MPNSEMPIKKSIDLTFFARLLISIAIVLLVYGFYLDVGSNSQLADPSVVDDPEKNSGNVTMIDIYHWDDTLDSSDIDEDPIEVKSTDDAGKSKSSTGSSGKSGSSKSGSGKSGSGKSGSGKSSGGGTSSGGSSSPGSGSGKTSPSSKPSTSTSPKPSTSPASSPSPSPSPSQTPSTPTMEQTNNNLRNQIQNTYGITIKYGMETAGYTVGGMSTTPITDAGRVNDSLNKLNNAMSLYPSGFFREISNGGIPLTVYLIERYSTGGVTGVTDSTNYYANISIAIAYPFDDSFHHENYHYMERYLYKKGIYYRSWDGYNPSDYVYVANGGPLRRNLSYANTWSEDAYFVNDYAQTSPEEDRASTFEYMMKSTKQSCFNSGKPVWNKAITMSNSIDAAINCVTPNTTEYWERNL